MKLTIKSDGQTILSGELLHIYHNGTWDFQGLIETDDNKTKVIVFKIEPDPNSEEKQNGSHKGRECGV